MHAYADRETDATEQGGDLEEKVGRLSVLEFSLSDKQLCVCLRCGVGLQSNVKCGECTSLLQIAEVESMLSVMGIEVTPSEFSAQDVSRTAGNKCYV